MDSGWRVVWQTAMILLLAGAALFTVTGISGKIHDRWIVEAPHTLDSMTFMNFAQYDDFGQRLDLSEDLPRHPLDAGVTSRVRRSSWKPTASNTTGARATPSTPACPAWWAGTGTSASSAG